MSYLGKERAGTEKETKGGKHHGNRGPQSSPVDLAEEGKRKDETDLADLVSWEHPGSLLTQQRVHQ